MSILQTHQAPKALSKSVNLPKIFQQFFKPSRYKIAYGGRGSGKSWAFAIMLILIAAQRPVRILCTREYQASIGDSVHKLLVDQIWALGLQNQFIIRDHSIKSKVGAEFIFKGLRINSQEIKSMEKIDYCWCEEAQGVSKESLAILEPTIRAAGSELWFTFNPNSIDDAMYDYVVRPRPSSIVAKVNFNSNPFFPSELKNLMEDCRANDPDAYDWIWLGNPRGVTDAQIFGGKYSIQEFEPPANLDRFYYGADWGFSTDPTAIVRCYLQGNVLYIDQEAYGAGIEVVDTPAFIKSVPGADRWPIRADCARPEIISHCRNHGLPNVEPCKKWPGSVEDGISYLRGLEKIIVHPRCKHMIEEFKLYSYKIDKQSGDVLPIIVDRNNHLCDALRYSLQPLITAKNTIRTVKINGF
jgi:phage terminase large subunit